MRELGPRPKCSKTCFDLNAGRVALRRNRGTDLRGGQDLREASAALLGCVGGGNGAVATSSRATVRGPLRSLETGLGGGERWALTPSHEAVPHAALGTWAAATSRAAARPAPRSSHGTSLGGGDDLGSGPAARGSAAPAAMRAARGRPLTFDWNARTCSLPICGVARRVVFGGSCGRS